MSVTSDIEIRLRADIARLQQDMTQVRQSVTNTMNAVERATDLAGRGLKALGGYFAVDAILAFAKSAIDAVDAIGDISPATGVAVQDIAGLQMAFQFGGMEAGSFEKTMIKLSGAIAAGDKSFNRINVATRTATGELRESKDVLYDVADRFAALEDGTTKTALAVDLFGKTGAAMIPMLNNGSEGLRKMAEQADLLGLSFTEAGVEAAGQFNDSLDTVGLMATGIGRQVAVQLLPTLNDLLGSFVTLATKGDGVRKMADIIGAGFKSIYTGAVIVGQVFDTLSSVIAISVGAVLDGFGTVAKTLKLFIQGDYAEAWEAANKGAHAVVNNAKNLGGDMVRSWEASAAAVSGVWSGASGAVVEDMNEVRKAFKLATEQTKEQEEANKKAAAAAEKLAADQKRAAEQNAAAYANLLGTIEDRIYATGREAAGLAALTQSQQMHRDLDQQLASGKLVLTASEVRYTRALIDTLGVNEDIIAANKQRVDDEKEWARIRAEVAEAQADAARKDAEAHHEFWGDINDTARDTFRSIADGGAALGKRLRDTLKNTFFDWLYQMTAKKWIINAETATAAGGGGIPSLIGAATGGNGVMGAVGNLYSSLAGGATMAGGLGTGFLGSLAGGLNGAGVGSGLTSSLGLSIGNNLAGALGPSISGALSSGLGAIASAMPWVAGAAAVYGIAKAAFGRGPKETTGTGITGTFGDSFSGESFTEWQKKGGWLRSTKRGTDTGALDPAMAATLGDAYAAMRASAAQFAEALGVPASAIDGYSKQIKLAFTGDAAKDQAALAAVLSEVGDELAGRVLPGLSQFALAGETASTTLARVVAGFQTVDAAFTTLGLSVERAFGAVGVASIEARERLLAMSGGVQSFAAQADFFAQNFLTDAQRIAPVQQMVNERLAALGKAGLTTSQEFSAAVLELADSGQLATEEGARTYAGLLALAPAFKQVADYLAETKRAADELAAAEAEKALEEAARAADALADAARNAAEQAARAAAEIEAENERQAQAMRSLLDTTFAGVQRAVAAQKDAVTAAYQRAMTDLQVSIDSVGESIKATRGLSQSLRAAVAGINVGGEGVARAAGQAQITDALRAARATGVLPTAEELKDALAAVTRDATNQFSSRGEYLREAARTARDLEELGAIADAQTGIAERQLAALYERQAQARSMFNQEITRLDGIMSAAQEQVDAIKGVDNSVKSVVEALAGFRGAVAGVGKPPVNTGGAVTGLSVEELYRQVLGREGDQGGLTFWRQAYGAVVDAAEIADFTRAASAELMAKAEGKWEQWLAAQNVTAPIYTSQQSVTMGGTDALLTELQTLNERMKKVETNTGQFAEQFDNATGGGGPLLVEPTKPFAVPA